MSLRRHEQRIDHLIVGIHIVRSDAFEGILVKPYRVPAVLLLVLAWGPAFAEWAWLQGTAVSEFTDSDWAAFQQRARAALEDGADGVVVDWSNPETGTRGQIKPLATFMYEGRPCRTAAFRTITGRGTRGQSVYTVCQQEDGTWKLVPDGTQPKPEDQAAEGDAE